MFPKRGAAALAVTTIALILLLSFKTPDQLVGNVNGSSNVAEVAPTATATVPDPTTATVPDTTVATPSATPDEAATPTPMASATTADATVTGPVVDTRWGPVQVEVTISGGAITDVVALQLPTGRRSGEISDQAAPLLREQALQTQSANIDGVSGATYTSYAYAESLQAALDQAGF
jgi:uncharacterized protein with FMN-binding domain